jgi:hypothetical protein
MAAYVKSSASMQKKIIKGKENMFYFEPVYFSWML